eukprot:scaffold42680_cov111-Cyclotella_meneghiniana.AAC.1
MNVVVFPAFVDGREADLMRREAVEIALAKQTATVGVKEACCGRGGAISRICWCMAAPRVATAHGQCYYLVCERGGGGGECGGWSV